MKIDVHAHYYPRAYLECMARWGFPASEQRRAANSGGTDSAADLHGRLQIMDEAGVAIQVLSSAAQGPYFEAQAAGIQTAEMINDSYAELCQRYPGRFHLFASAPLPHIDASLRELERAFEQLGAVGATVTTTVLGKAIADPDFDWFFAELDRRKAALFIHPAGIGACCPPIQDYGLSWPIGAPIEDTIVVMQLLVKQIPYRFPNVKIIAAHLGGALPMLLGRLDHLLGRFLPELPEDATAMARRLWYDTVGHNSTPALRCACETLGADRLVLGSDFPYLKDDYYRGCVSYIERSGMPPADIEWILGGNAGAMLGLPG